MNKTIPFTNDIVFSTKIASITSISLEHEVTINDTEINGNFIISGDYKTHEVSVNKEKFNYSLPFSVDLPDNVIKDTINFDISDFTYDVIGDDTLRVNIEFNVEANLNEEQLTPIIKKTEDIIFDEEIERKEKEENEIIEKEEKEVEIKEKDEEIKLVNEEEQVAPSKRINDDIKENIISTINSDEDTYTTYYVHIVRENETIESICEKLHTTKDIIENYNDITTLSINDKLIIPKNTDE